MNIELRPIQEEAIRLVLSAIDEGKTDILVQAPTGVGKSLIALELAKILEGRGEQSFILTSEKLLQQQYEDDCAGKFAPRHSDKVSISGVDNYSCHINGKTFSLGHCKTMGLSNRKALRLPCAGGCEYLQRWQRAQAAGTAIFNYSYYLLQMNYVWAMKLGQYAPFQPRPIVICDEAHSLPNSIENHFACHVDREIVGKIKDMQEDLRQEGVILQFLGAKWGDLGKAIGELFRIKYQDVTGQHHHLKIVYEIGVEIRQRVLDSKETIRYKYKLSISDDATGEDLVAAAMAANESLPGSVRRFLTFADEWKDYMCKLEDYVNIIEEQGLENMVVEGKPGGRIYRNLCDELLYDRHFRRFSRVRIFLSATLQPANLIQRWGLKESTTSVIRLHSGWDPERSPIVLKRTANFKYSNINAAMEDAVRDIDKILKDHPNERGVIHTTSYDILNYIKEHCKEAGRLVPYQGTVEKVKLIKGLSELPKNAVIIGPSLTQGVDLHNDLARFSIIVKLSYPNIGAALWRKRFQLKRFIYWAEAANVLEQAAGRATRHIADQSVTYVLDDRADKFIKQPSTRKYFSDEFLSRVAVGKV